MSELGAEIRKIRELKKASLRTVAAGARISPPFLSDIELGRRYPATQTLIRIATSLDTPYTPLYNLMRKDHPTIESLQAELSAKQSEIERLELKATSLEIHLIEVVTSYKDDHAGLLDHFVKSASKYLKRLHTTMQEESQQGWCEDIISNIWHYFVGKKILCGEVIKSVDMIYSSAIPICDSRCLKCSELAALRKE